MDKISALKDKLLQVYGASITHTQGKKWVERILRAELEPLLNAIDDVLEDKVVMMWNKGKALADEVKRWKQ